jgi:hypothetical protein
LEGGFNDEKIHCAHYFSHRRYQYYLEWLCPTGTRTRTGPGTRTRPGSGTSTRPGSGSGTRAVSRTTNTSRTQ